MTDGATKKRRVLLRADFTAKGKLDDIFGHGTHVAGVIAGNGGASLAWAGTSRGSLPRPVW